MYSANLDVFWGMSVEKSMPTPSLQTTNPANEVRAVMMDPVNLLTVVVLGLYAGSLLTEGMLLVPHWRSMEPENFFRLHGEFGPRLFRYFAPLTIAAVALSIIAVARGFFGPSGHNFWAWLAAGLLLIVLAIFYFHFRAANLRFAESSLSNDALKKELSRWSHFHTFRTILAIAAFAAYALSAAP